MPGEIFTATSAADQTIFKSTGYTARIWSIYEGTNEWTVRQKWMIHCEINSCNEKYWSSSRIVSFYSHSTQFACPILNLWPSIDNLNWVLSGIIFCVGICVISSRSTCLLMNSWAIYASRALILLLQGFLWIQASKITIVIMLTSIVIVVCLHSRVIFLRWCKVESSAVVELEVISFFLRKLSAKFIESFHTFFSKTF